MGVVRLEAKCSRLDPLPQAVKPLCQLFCLSPRQAAEGERSASKFENGGKQWAAEGRKMSSLRSQEVVFASGVGGGVGDCGNGREIWERTARRRLVGRAAVQSRQVSIVSFLQRPRGCLLPSASEPPTYSAGLGQTGDAGSFRELDSAKPSVFGLQSQRGGPLRGRPLAETVDGDPAGPAGGPRYGAGVGLTDSGGGVGCFSGGQRGEPHDGRPLTQLEHPLSKGESLPEASF